MGFDHPTLSPDGKRSSSRSVLNRTADLWILDAARGTQTRLSQTEGAEVDPVWTPDGNRVIYRHRSPEGESTIRIMNADGSTAPETLVDRVNFSFFSRRRDLRFSPGVKNRASTTCGGWSSGPGGSGADRPSASSEPRGRISPDGGTLSPTNRNESGHNEIYLKRFPSGRASGRSRWTAVVAAPESEGRESYSRSRGGDLMVVEVQTEPEITLGTPRRLFSWNRPIFSGGTSTTSWLAAIAL